MNRFQGPMQPYHGLETWSRQALLKNNQGSLFFFDTGEEAAKTPVLLVHGLGDEADTWRHVLPGLQPQFRVIAPDLPGFGRSELPQCNLSVPFFASTLLDLLDHLSLSNVVLVGHSMGAVIAHQLALGHPERVERLVLISGSLVSKENNLNFGLLAFLIPGLGEWLYMRLRKDPQAAYRSLASYYRNLDELPQGERDFLFQRVNERVWSNSQRQGYFSSLRGLVSWLPAQQKGLPARLSGWQTPVTLLWGEDDHVTPLANAQALKELLPTLRLEIVQGAGHNLQQEKPQVVVQAIQNRNSP